MPQAPQLAASLWVSRQRPLQHDEPMGQGLLSLHAVAGTSAAGVSVAGTSAAGVSVAGVSDGGTSAAGVSSAEGTSGLPRSGVAAASTRVNSSVGKEHPGAARSSAASRRGRKRFMGLGPTLR
jgi:hypothetical protein